MLLLNHIKEEEFLKDPVKIIKQMSDPEEKIKRKVRSPMGT